jgi:phage terminase small subunit
MPDGHTNISLDEAATSLKVIDGGRASAKLTAKQSAYVQAILKGANQSDAYRSAYDAENMSDQAIWSEASRLFANPKVSARIKAGKRRLEEAELHSALALRQHIERGLFEMTTNAETDSAKLRAFELLGKSEKVGYFLDRSADVGVEDLSEEEVTQQLEEKLREAFGEPTDKERWGQQ